MLLMSRKSCETQLQGPGLDTGIDQDFLGNLVFAQSLGVLGFSWVAFVWKVVRSAEQSISNLNVHMNHFGFF